MEIENSQNKKKNNSDNKEESSIIINNIIDNKTKLQELIGNEFEEKLHIDKFFTKVKSNKSQTPSLQNKLKYNLSKSYNGSLQSQVKKHKILQESLAHQENVLEKYQIEINKKETKIANCKLISGRRDIWVYKRKQEIRRRTRSI